MRPSYFPSFSPSINPSASPIVVPSYTPSVFVCPTMFPSYQSNKFPSFSPSIYPSIIPSESPSLKLSPTPSTSHSPSFASHWEQIGADINGETDYEEMGTSVSTNLDGSVVAIGAPKKNSNGVNSGQVRVYKWENHQWTLMGGDLNGREAKARFGRSLSLSGDGLILGCGGQQFSSGNGYIQIYEYVNNTWAQRGSDIDGEGFDDYFGADIRLSDNGTIIAAGARKNDGNGTDSGHVRVYEWGGTSWSQIGSDIDGDASGDKSGWAIDLSAAGDTVAIGARHSGYVKIYTWSGIAWGQKGSDIHGNTNSDAFGIGISLSSDANTVAIGGYLNDGNGSDAGHVRAYQWSGSAWVQVGSDIEGDSAGDTFGHSVSLSSNGHILAIGSPSYNTPEISSGYVRIFKLSNNLWVQISDDIVGEADGDSFGFEVCLSSDGHTLVIGGPLNDGCGTDCGHVRVFDLYEPPTSFPSNSPSIAPN